MEASPLDQAYSLARKADSATQSGDLANAAALHLEAAEQFAEARQSTHSVHAQQTLDSLSRIHKNRAQFLEDVHADERLLKQRPRQQSPDEVGDLPGHDATRLIQHDELTASLASARGIRSSASSIAAAAAAAASASGPKKKLSEDDPFYRFYAAINTTFTKAFNAAMDRAKQDQASPAGSKMNPAATLMMPMNNESFYVVSNSANQTNEELATENANLRQMINRTSAQLHAYETAVKKQKDTLKSYLLQLRNQLNTREASLDKQHEAEIEMLRSENDKLKIQIGRMKSRWDDLKESARKRREDTEEIG